RRGKLPGGVSGGQLSGGVVLREFPRGIVLGKLLRVVAGGPRPGDVVSGEFQGGLVSGLPRRRRRQSPGGIPLPLVRWRAGFRRGGLRRIVPRHRATVPSPAVDRHLRGSRGRPASATLPGMVVRGWGGTVATAAGVGVAVG